MHRPGRSVLADPVDEDTGDVLVVEGVIDPAGAVRRLDGAEQYVLEGANRLRPFHEWQLVGVHVAVRVGHRHQPDTDLWHGLGQRRELSERYVGYAPTLAGVPSLTRQPPFD